MRAASSAYCACFRVLIVLRPLPLSGTGVGVGGLGSSAAMAGLFMFYSACAGLDGVISAAQYTFSLYTTHLCTKWSRAQLRPRRPCAALLLVAMNRTSGGALLVLRLRRVLLGSHAGGSRMLDGPSEEGEGRGWGVGGGNMVSLSGEI